MPAKLYTDQGGPFTNDHTRVVCANLGIRLLHAKPYHAWSNAYAERHVREIRETLDDLILLGESHLRRALGEIQEYHNGRRPHQGIGNVIPASFAHPVEPALPAEVECQEALGGLLNQYCLKKAA